MSTADLLMRKGLCSLPFSKFKDWNNRGFWNDRGFHIKHMGTVDSGCEMLKILMKTVPNLFANYFIIYRGSPSRSATF